MSALPYQNSDQVAVYTMMIHNNGDDGPDDDYDDYAKAANTKKTIMMITVI